MPRGNRPALDERKSCTEGQPLAVFSAPSAPAFYYSLLPSLAVLPAQVVVGLRHVRDSHIGAVIVNLLSGAQRHDTEKHDLGEARGVFERAGGLKFSLGCVHPVHFVGFLVDTRQLLPWFAERVVERLGEQPRLQAVSVVKQLALAPDEQRAALLI